MLDGNMGNRKALVNKIRPRNLINFKEQWQHVLVHLVSNHFCWLYGLYAILSALDWWGTFLPNDVRSMNNMIYPKTLGRLGDVKVVRGPRPKMLRSHQFGDLGRGRRWRSLL